MEVLASDGQHVGTVDHMEGADKIKLTRAIGALATASPHPHRLGPPRSIHTSISPRTARRLRSPGSMWPKARASASKTARNTEVQEIARSQQIVRHHVRLGSVVP